MLVGEEEGVPTWPCDCPQAGGLHRLGARLRPYWAPWVQRTILKAFLWATEEREGPP